MLLACGRDINRSEQVPIAKALSTEKLTLSPAAPCEPTFLKVSEQPLEAWAGDWKFGFDAFLIGCDSELKQVRDSDRTIIIQYLIERVEEEGLPFFSESRSRSPLVSNINSAIKHEALTDILIVRRYSIEHDPRPALR
jgi:hypothetical protein